MASRTERLMPGGVPRYVRCYDNGGETIDRYTVVYSGRIPGQLRGWCQYVGMSAAPFHPQGFGQHGEADHAIDVDRWGFPPALGRRGRLGRRIPFGALPADCRRLVLEDYRELWEIK